MSNIGVYMQIMPSGRRFIREEVPLRILLWHNLARSPCDLMEKQNETVNSEV